MPIAKFQMPDGRIARFEVPEGTTPEQAHSLIQNSLSPQNEQQNAKEKSGLLNLGEGVLIGAGGVGRTLLAPVKGIADFISPPESTLETLVTGKKKLNPVSSYINRIDEGLKQLDTENKDSVLYQIGKNGSQIAMTAPVGGVLASGLTKLAPSAVNLAQALRTGGFSGGNLGTRMAGGAISGGASAGLADLKEAKAGALIGGGIPLVGTAVKGIGRALRGAAGMQSGAGSDALKIAYEAGQEGGQAAKQFKENIGGKADFADALDNFKQNISNMRQAAQAEYRSGMANVSKDKTILDVQPIYDAVKNAAKSNAFKGISKDDKAAEVLKKIKSEINDFQFLNPAEYHTPEGLDALKQRVDSIIESIPIEDRNSLRVANNVKGAIKQQIEKQAPEYSNVMKKYSVAADEIDQAQKALLSGRGENVESSIRKLQSLMRNNANTNYGMRGEMAKNIQEAGGNEFMPALAGQALREWTPRGLQKAAAAPSAALGYMAGGVPTALMGAALSSPRLSGETAFMAGQIAKKLRNPTVLNARETAVKITPTFASQYYED
jgi:hypothetical protein